MKQNLINRLTTSYREYPPASAGKKLEDANESILFTKLLHQYNHKIMSKINLRSKFPYKKYGNLHTIQWKKNYQILILKKYRRTLSNHIDNPLPKTFIADYYFTQQKRTTTCPNAQKTTTQTVTTADSQKTTQTKMHKNTKNMDTPSDHTYQTDRKNLYTATTPTLFKRLKHI